MKRFCKLFWLIQLIFALVLQVSAQSAQQEREAPAEHHVTKAEAKELFRSVDEILKFASEHTGLPIRHSVKKKLASREEVAKYIAAQLKEQRTRERFDHSEVTLKKLGLIPRDFNLRPYLLGLYKEQVEGWYDSHNKTVYLLDWVAPELQKPVMAHELVHALQDQNFDLEKWMNIGRDSRDEIEQMALDEQRLARQAIVEGQAMIALFDYQLSPIGKTVESAPELVDSMQSAMTDEGVTPLYAKAPLYLREAMLFPYTYGMNFIRAVLANRGKQAAFAGVFEHPPLDTRQIMQPATYLSGEPQPEIKFVSLDKVLGPDWRRDDFSGVGEIDLHVILKQWGGPEPAKKLAQAWRGGYYMTLSNEKSPKNTPVSLAMVLTFASPSATNDFVHIYGPSLSQRYKSVKPAGSPREWNTEEGMMRLYVSGSTAIALESFAAEDAAKLHDAIVTSLAKP